MATRRDRKRFERVVARAMRPSRRSSWWAGKAWHWPVVAVAGASLVPIAVWLVAPHVSLSRTSSRKVEDAPAAAPGPVAAPAQEVGDRRPDEIPARSPRGGGEALRGRAASSRRGAGDGSQQGQIRDRGRAEVDVLPEPGVERGSPESLPGLCAGPGSATPKRRRAGRRVLPDRAARHDEAVSRHRCGASTPGNRRRRAGEMSREGARHGPQGRGDRRRPRGVRDVRVLSARRRRDGALRELEPTCRRDSGRGEEAVQRSAGVGRAHGATRRVQVHERG